MHAVGKTPVWMFHGTLDPVVPPKESQIMYQAFSASGGDVRLWLYEGWHHNSWDKAYAERSLPQWLLAHRLSDIATAHAEAQMLTVPLHPVPAKVDPDIYDDYVGDYYDGEVRQVTILVEGDKLFSRNRTNDLNELLPENATTYFYPSGSPTRIIFQKDSSGRVTGILYHDDRHEEHWERLMADAPTGKQISCDERFSKTLNLGFGHHDGLRSLVKTLAEIPKNRKSLCPSFLDGEWWGSLARRRGYEGHLGASPPVTAHTVHRYQTAIDRHFASGRHDHDKIANVLLPLLKQAAVQH